jgi:hypothetical protein
VLSEAPRRDATDVAISAVSDGLAKGGLISTAVRLYVKVNVSEI